MTVLARCSGVSEEQQTRSQREYELAVSLYHDERNTPSAIVSLERSIQLDPENAEAHLLLGQVLGGSELYAQAEPHLARAVVLFTPLAQTDPEKIARLDEARNSLAAALINLGRPAEAVAALRPIIDDVHYPAQHLALGNLGQAYLALHRYADAAHALERAVALRPDFCVGNYRLGEARIHSGDDGHALEALDRAIATHAPGCDRIQPAFRARGEVHTRLHQPDAARTDFERCRDLGPNTQDGRDCASQLRTQVSP